MKAMNILGVLAGAAAVTILAIACMSQLILILGVPVPQLIETLESDHEEQSE